MMKADPYGESDDLRAVDRQFLNDLRSMLEKGESYPEIAEIKVGTGDQITPQMREVRSLAVENRLEVYKKSRIDDQRSWYSSKASTNRKLKRRIFGVVLMAQFTAFGFAIWTIIQPSRTFDPTGILATTATAFMAWMQVKRYDELAQSYSVASQDLGMVAEEAQHLESEEDLTDFVADAENAISREHTLWLARRDHLTSISDRL
jgi:hypothetical protein